MRAGRDDAGALANFVGYCRAATEGAAVEELAHRPYPGFTEKEIARLTGEVARPLGTAPICWWSIGWARIKPGEAIVLVAALAAHRARPSRRCKLLMDYLKTDAPLWKKETGPAGARWIEPQRPRPCAAPAGGKGSMA